MDPRPNTIENDVRPDLDLVLRLDESARDALLRQIDHLGVLPLAMSQLARKLAVGTLREIPRHIERQHGREGSALAYRVAHCVENPFWGGMYSPGDGPSGDILTLLKAPDWYLLQLLEQALDVAARAGNAGRFDTASTREQLRRDLNEVLRNAGDDYVIGDDYRTATTHDVEVVENVVEPALRVLKAPELDRVQRDFRAALEALRRGTQEGFRSAVNDAGAAVEGMLLVLRDDHGLQDRRTTPTVSFELLRDSDVIPAHMDHTVLAPSRIRNKEAAHSSQSTPRAPGQPMAQAAVFGAAIAITYLASLRLTAR